MYVKGNGCIDGLSICQLQLFTRVIRVFEIVRWVKSYCRVQHSNQCAYLSEFFLQNPESCASLPFLHPIEIYQIVCSQLNVFNLHANEQKRIKVMSHRDGAATLTPNLHMLVLHATCRWGCAATRGNQITFSCAILLRGYYDAEGATKGCVHVMHA